MSHVLSMARGNFFQASPLFGGRIILIRRRQIGRNAFITNFLQGRPHGYKVSGRMARRHNFIRDGKNIMPLLIVRDIAR